MIGTEKNYRAVFESLGFEVAEPGELREKMVLRLPRLPENPVAMWVLLDKNKKKGLVLIIVIDPTGEVWTKTERRNNLTDLGPHGVEDYVDFCEKNKPHGIN